MAYIWSLDDIDNETEYHLYRLSKVNCIVVLEYNNKPHSTDKQYIELMNAAIEQGRFLHGIVFVTEHAVKQKVNRQ